jgi:hypothetical protein
LRFLAVEEVDGRQTYHLRSTYFRDGYGEPIARLDFWFSTDQDYLIRLIRTTKAGKIVQSVNNRWLPRTPPALALTTAPIPTGFKRVAFPS